MRNVALFLSVCVLLTLSVIIGTNKEDDFSTPELSSSASENSGIPNIGRVQILNGCGINGAASAAADYLREYNFDVKDIGNAETWNYPHTIVASRTKDMTVAGKVADALDTKRIILLRDEKHLYDVTVFLGADYGDIIDE